MDRKEIVISGDLSVEGVEYHYDGHAGYSDDGNLMYVNIDHVMGPDGELNPITLTNPLLMDIWLHANEGVRAVMDLQSGRKL